MPAKVKKAARPVRHGRVFFVTDGKGRFLIHKRAGKGLYEGMYQLPTTEWLEKRQGGKAGGFPFAARLSGLADTGAQVRHVFTHFELFLDVWMAKTKAAPKGCIWITAADMPRYALPTLMKKAVRLCIGGTKGV